MKIDVGQNDLFHPKLQEILEWMEDSIGVEFLNTSNYRPDDDGVHGTIPLRGWDLRMRSETVGQAIADHVNDEWEYDPARPDYACVVLHGHGEGGLHLHVQVHDNTRRL